MEDAYAQLRDIYYNPLTGFTSAEKLKKRVPKLTLKRIKDWIQQQEVAQTHKPYRESKHQLPITWESSVPFQRMQMDLVPMEEFPKQPNGDYNQFLLIVDTYSRYMFAKPAKSKSAIEAKTLLSQCLEEAFHLAPVYPIRRIDSDNESAFKSRSVQSLLSSWNIMHKMNEPGDHKALAFIDRGVRTVRDLLNRVVSAYGTNNWVQYLPAVIENYNTRPHDSLGGLSPTQAVESEEPVPKIIVSRVAAKVKAASLSRFQQNQLGVGDAVRIRLGLSNRETFRKGTNASWSTTIFKVEEVDSRKKFNRYKVNSKWYRRTDLLPVNSETVAHAPKRPGSERVTSAQSQQDAHKKHKVVKRRVEGKEGVDVNYEPVPKRQRRHTRAVNYNEELNFDSKGLGDVDG